MGASNVPNAGVIAMSDIPSCPPCPICRGTGRGYGLRQPIYIAGVQVAGRYGVEVGWVTSNYMLAFRVGEYLGAIAGLRSNPRRSAGAAS